ncbi:MAG TPA: 1,4-alpha-glucan branching protein GlgB [Acidimicrobiales bacterium]|nr:1,4-alpha-glucan branching protein GlgB [Acidimicrobiales bacterium]
MSDHYRTSGADRSPLVDDSFSLTSDDLYLFNEGTHRRLGNKIGAHAAPGGGIAFAVWAPNARRVSVMGDFNGWDPHDQPLVPRGTSGVWEGVVECASRGDVYKYAITTEAGAVLEKADPFASCTEEPPRTGSVVWDLSYEWRDEEWMRTRGQRASLAAPVSIYELHLGSWRRDPTDPERFLSYREVAEPLIEHVRACGFTHVEFLPLMEHPFYGSWGYQTTGFFAPTRRYGDPQDLMYLIDELHRAGIGVIFDWVPSHFPADAFALAEFDGTHLFEHADVRLGFHPDWKSLIFNYGRHEVRSFLASSAEHWLSTYHVDALRVDAVASMLYLDYSRRPGEWLPNIYGGRENIEAIEFLRQLNTGIYADHPDVQVIAEESTAFPGISRPVDAGGVGFGLKWDMGWMHDTLEYLSRDAIHRRHHHGELTFRSVYAFSENFLLPLSHDEVVYGKGSLLTKMPGDDWQKFANVRLLFGYQFAQPGKKLVFMGGEFAQRHEWEHDSSLDWALLDNPAHAGMQRWMGDLNRIYRDVPALHEMDCDPRGFAWAQPNDADTSLLSFLRYSSDGQPVLVVCNFTPVPRYNCLAGVPVGGNWRELLNSDAALYGGSGIGNLGGVEARPIPAYGMSGTLTLTVPPLGCLFLAPE